LSIWINALDIRYYLFTYVDGLSCDQKSIKIYWSILMLQIVIKLKNIEIKGLQILIMMIFEMIVLSISQKYIFRSLSC